MSAETAQIRDPDPLLRGTAPPAPTPRELQAGPLTVELHGIELAYIRIGDREVVRRIHAAVRDENWDTVLPVIRDMEVDETNGGFTARFAARHESGAIAFSWDGVIEGGSDGSLCYSLDGHAERAFPYARIGFCILHAPDEYAGRPYRTELSGKPTSGRLPIEIASQLFRNGVYLPALQPYTRLEVQLDDGLEVAFDLDGDEFELEDQRNWTDASFKTYSTPMHLGYPHQAVAGQPFQQSVRVTVAGKVGDVRPRRRAGVVVDVGEPLGHGLPPLGTAASAEGGTGSAGLLRQLGLAHVRVALELGEDRTESALAGGAALALAAGAGVEAAVFATADSIGHVGALLRGLPPEVALIRVSVFDRDAEVTPASLIREARASLADAGIAAPVGGGTDGWFAEINRDPPDPVNLDYLTYSITPQVHAFDDISLAETLEMQRMTVDSAHALAGGKPIVIGPVTLRPRGADPDPRQNSLFCAAWTVGSVKQFALARADAVTYYEAFGPNGVADVDPFPVYHALVEVHALTACELLRVDSNEPTRVEAIAASGDGDRVRLLVANLRLATERVTIASLTGSIALVRTLDVDALRAGNPRQDRIQIRGGKLTLELQPYAIAAIEVVA